MSVCKATAARSESRAGEARVGVVGLGYVGLPLAVEFARSGLTVHRHRPRPAEGRRHQRGELVHPRRADGRRAGTARRRPAVGDDRLQRRRRSSTRSTSACRRRCARRRTPTCPTSCRRSRRSPQHLHPGMLVVLESTTYPGTTEEVVQPMLERGGPEGRRRLLPRLLARARRSGQRDVQDAQRAEGRRRHRRRTCAELARALYGDGDRHGRAGQLDRASPRW